MSPDKYHGDEHLILDSDYVVDDEYYDDQYWGDE
jgi:hypothetical protein